MQARIQSIRLKNFRAFKKIDLKICSDDDIKKNNPSFCVFVGANGTGKSTIFSVFNFLKRAMETNVTTALGELGHSRGFKEVRTRGESGNIEIELKFRDYKLLRNVTYLLVIGEKNGKAIVELEKLSYRKGSYGRPWEFLKFSRGSGEAVTSKFEEVKEEKDLTRETHTLKSSDILAIKGLAQFEKFQATVSLGELIENWHVCDFHIQANRKEQDGYSETLNKSGDNLSLVIDYLYKNHKVIFGEITEKLAARVPGINSVEAKMSEDGRVLLYFHHKDFENPILARFISDGTLRMLTYLVLLYHPKKQPLLGIEEPENQLYPSLLEELAEEFRMYAVNGGQVFVSTQHACHAYFFSTLAGL